MTAEWSPSATDTERLDELTEEIAQRASEMQGILVRAGVPVGPEARFSLERSVHEAAGLMQGQMHVLVPKWCDDSGCCAGVARSWSARTTGQTAPIRLFAFVDLAEFRLRSTSGPRAIPRPPLPARSARTRR